MSSASSHSESRSIEILVHRSRVLSHPFGDSVSVVVVPSSGVSSNSGIADALVVMQSFFNVESIMITHRLVDVRKNYFIPPEYKLHVPLPGERPYDTSPCDFNLSTDTLEAGLRFLLHPIIKACLEEWGITPSQMAPNSWRYLMFNLDKMKSGDKAGSGSMAPSAASVPTAGDAEASTTEKCPSSRVGAGLRKRLRKATVEQPTDALGSIARTSVDKGKGIVELEEVPERGYTMREICEVKDRAGVDKYFASIMTRLRCIDSEDPLVPRWLTISGSSQIWTKGPLSGDTCGGLYTPSW
ncbi:hypothetical protein BHM03_00007315 [Ensete ventricosum]|nr:hypothetical protein BHM03_00007315 [Ensete ventricosum]